MLLYDNAPCLIGNASVSKDLILMISPIIVGLFALIGASLGARMTRKRVAVLTQEDPLASNLESSTGSIAVPASLPNIEWSQPGGDQSKRTEEGKDQARPEGGVQRLAGATRIDPTRDRLSTGLARTAG